MNPEWHKIKGVANATDFNPQPFSHYFSSFWVYLLLSHFDAASLPSPSLALVATKVEVVSLCPTPQLSSSRPPSHSPHTPCKTNLVNSALDDFMILVVWGWEAVFNISQDKKNNEINAQNEVDVNIRKQSQENSSAYRAKREWNGKSCSSKLLFTGTLLSNSLSNMVCIPTHILRFSLICTKTQRSPLESGCDLQVVFRKG